MSNIDFVGCHIEEDEADFEPRVKGYKALNDEFVSHRRTQWWIGPMDVRSCKKSRKFNVLGRLNGGTISVGLECIMFYIDFSVVRGKVRSGVAMAWRFFFREFSLIMIPIEALSNPHRCAASCLVWELTRSWRSRLGKSRSVGPLSPSLRST